MINSIHLLGERNAQGLKRALPHANIQSDEDAAYANVESGEFVLRISYVGRLTLPPLENLEALIDLVVQFDSEVPDSSWYQDSIQHSGIEYRLISVSVSDTSVELVYFSNTRFKIHFNAIFPLSDSQRRRCGLC